MRVPSNKTGLWLPSFADIVFFCPFLLLSLVNGNALLNDAGTGFHIRAGEYIINNFTIPKRDIFSYITPPLPWIAHEWLSEVIMAGIHRAFGLTGVVLFFSFLIALTYFLLFNLVRIEGSDLILGCFIVFLATVSSALHWLARPHIFSFILTVVWYSILDMYQYRHKNYLYCLPPLMLLWVNLHGAFITGFILLGIYLVGNAVGAFCCSDSGSSKFKNKFVALTFAASVCLLFSFVNPYGYQILLFPFRLVSNQFLVDYIMEYQSPNFHDPLPFKYLLLLTIGVLAVSRGKVDIIELSLVFLFTYMALYSTRHIPLFAIIVAPILARHTEAMLQKSNNKLMGFLKFRSNNLAVLDNQPKGHLWPVIFVLAACILAGTGLIRFKFDEKKMPVGAVNFLKSENLKGNMYNPDQFGDYVVYAAWPQYKVLVDGRIDMYGKDNIQEDLRIARVQPGWHEAMAKYNINFVLDHVDSPLSMQLGKLRDWRLVYADKVANVFVRNAPQHQSLIKEYPNADPFVSDSHSSVPADSEHLDK